MPYVVLKSCFAAGGRRSAGDVLNIPADEAKTLTAMGRIEYVTPSKKEEQTDRSVALEGSKTPKPTTRRKKRED
ncbi:MAG: hypothetical protein GY766_05565 [Herbaspirillum sp.]|jgi:hypothetical protein|uniref:hypothetical protein n=1 Tax=Herbaspirillum sp. TaxID=1890675 RepID=UPI002586C30B|nr:hypothetical protein [Herbaspirillum sp.]MCP3654351.1 hypothetical protein [Herbaspirillum sp.]